MPRRRSNADEGLARPHRESRRFELSRQRTSPRYRGTLEDGTEFDRGDRFKFTIDAGEVPIGAEIVGRVRMRASEFPLVRFTRSRACGRACACACSFIRMHMYVPAVYVCARARARACVRACVRAYMRFVCNARARARVCLSGDQGLGPGRQGHVQGRDPTPRDPPQVVISHHLILSYKLILYSISIVSYRYVLSALHCSHTVRTLVALPRNPLL